MATKTQLNIKPKVFTGLLTGLGVAALGGIATSLDPHIFDGLGDFGAPLFSLVTIAASTAGAWLKKEEDGSEEPAKIVTVATVDADTSSLSEDPVPLEEPTFDAVVAPVEEPVVAAPARHTTRKTAAKKSA